MGRPLAVLATQVFGLPTLHQRPVPQSLSRLQTLPQEPLAESQ
jgi:hypothetical protein